MGKSISEKCPSCNATIKFDAKENHFKCEYCGNVWTIDDIKAEKEKKKKLEVKRETPKTMDVNVYNCENCGASIILGDNTASTSCVYCKSTQLIMDRLEGVYAPSKIITFKFDKNDAINKFKELCKGRKLMPKDFDNIDNIQDMEGLYVPFWLYDCDNDLDVTCECTNVSTWSDARYINTKTDYYEVKGIGTLVYDKVPNDGAVRFDDKIMNAIEPFDYSELKDFSEAYLSGYISEKFDVSQEEAYKNVQERINNASKSYILSKVTGYNSKRITSYSGNLTLRNSNYVLLPVWVLNIKYKDKIYRFSMNGQTGKYVGEIPVDTKKLWLLIIITFAISVLIMVLIFFVSGVIA